MDLSNVVTFLFVEKNVLQLLLLKALQKCGTYIISITYFDFQVMTENVLNYPKINNQQYRL